jgi:hypothetical protein
MLMDMGISRLIVQRAMWYKFGGGKEKIDSRKLEAKKFWADHKDIANRVYDDVMMYAKEIAIGDVTMKEVIGIVCKDNKIDEFPEYYLDTLL